MVQETSPRSDIRSATEVEQQIARAFQLLRYYTKLSQYYVVLGTGEANLDEMAESALAKSASELG